MSLLVFIEHAEREIVGCDLQTVKLKIKTTNAKCDPAVKLSVTLKPLC